MCLWSVVCRNLSWETVIWLCGSYCVVIVFLGCFEFNLLMFKIYLSRKLLNFSRCWRVRVINDVWWCMSREDHQFWFCLVTYAHNLTFDINIELLQRNFHVIEIVKYFYESAIIFRFFQSDKSKDYSNYPIKFFHQIRKRWSGWQIR